MTNEQSILIKEGWQFRKAGQTDWLPATVPGCVHTDLQANGLIPDPFYRLNEKEVQWIETENWEYRCVFEIEDQSLDNQSVELVFDGLDTYARVWLNEKELGYCDNMFRQWTFDCASTLKKGHNELRVLFLSPYKTAEKEYDASPLEYPANNDEGAKRVSPFTRKAPYQYGWDWGPRLLTSGIWRNVSLRFRNQAVISGFQVFQEELTSRSALLRIEIDIMSFAEYEPLVWVHGGDLCLYNERIHLKPGENHLECHIEIADTILWWPHGMGEPFLYQISATIETLKGHRHSRKHSVGLRTIELVTPDDDRGQGFYFKVNGQPLFVRGANIIPLDYFPSNVKPSDYEVLVENAIAANFNMLRAWGGAFYEDDYLYALCDRKGLLVWQDFVFACGMYPAGEDFLNNLRQEFIYNIKRLRNHACIALWCGNNEVLEGWHFWGWQDGRTDAEKAILWNDYGSVFYDLLPSVLQACDPGRPYRPSSPSATYSDPPALHSGDYHFWDIVKEDLPVSVYTQNVGRFMSEYGFKSYPEKKTLLAYSHPTDWDDLRCAVMEEHQGWFRGCDLVQLNMLREYGHAPDFDTFLYLGQLLQAFALRTAIEAHRRAKPQCMGTLYWQLNDVWPCASWATYDYFGRWKAAHYMVRNVYQDVIVSGVVENGIIQLWLVSEFIETFSGMLVFEVLRFDGTVLNRYERAVSLGCDAALKAVEVSEKEAIGDSARTEVVCRAGFLSQGYEICSSVFFLVPAKDLDLPLTSIDVKKTANNQSVELSLTSNVFAHGVCISSQDTECHFSDNYFDLFPGEQKRVQVYSRQGVVADAAFQVRAFEPHTT